MAAAQQRYGIRSQRTESALRDDRIVVAAVTCCPLSWSTTIG
jgi:hypothetical protein